MFTQKTIDKVAAEYPRAKVVTFQTIMDSTVEYIEVTKNIHIYNCDRCVWVLQINGSEIGCSTLNHTLKVLKAYLGG